MRFRLNSPDVLQERIEGEVIVVHVLTGSYYSLLGSGAAIWSDILRGVDAETIIDQFVASGSENRVTVSAEVHRFLGELWDEQLVVVYEPGATVAPVPGDAPAPDGLVPFEPPSLQKYSDMQEILLVDPIHEVDSGGWPMKKPKSGN